MKNRIVRVSLIVFALLLLTLLGGAAVLSKGSEGGPVASVAIETDVVTWEPQEDGGGFMLTISGPDTFYLREEYAAGAAATFEAVDRTGAPRPDGVYRYELWPLSAADQSPAATADEQRGLVEVEDAGRYTLQSGSFSILNGVFVLPDIVEDDPGAGTEGDATPEDNLIYDDLIVTGSTCVGFDCADGESFGFDTIILKEHNLRIYFNDTSYTASYPTNGWRITVNDSTNGGASYFAIDDVDEGTTPFKVEAGAPSNSLYVEDYGRVGLGTSTPVVEMHIKDSDSPTIRLEQDSSGGWTPQTFDLCANESNFFIRDATHGSRLPFRIQPSAPSSSLCIKSNGYIGIGTWSPDQALEVERHDGNAMIKVEELNGTVQRRTLLRLVNNGPSRMAFSNTNTNVKWNMGMTNSDEFALSRQGDAFDQFVVAPNGDLTIHGTLHQGSDVNSKQDFAPVDTREILARVLELPITSWTFKGDDAAARHLGPMAQDFFQAFGLGVDDRHISTLDAEGVALAAIQGLKAENDAQIQALETRLAELEQAAGREPMAGAGVLTVLPWVLCGFLLGVVATMGTRLLKRAA